MIIRILKAIIETIWGIWNKIPDGQKEIIKKYVMKIIEELLSNYYDAWKKNQKEGKA